MYSFYFICYLIPRCELAYFKKKSRNVILNFYNFSEEMNSKYQHIQHHKITQLSWTVSLINQTEGWAITLAVHRVGLLVRSTLFHDLHLNIDHLLSCVAISVIIICSPAIASIHTPTYMLLLYFSQGNPQMLKQSPDVPDTKYALNIKILLTGSAGLGHLLKKRQHHLQFPRFFSNPVNTQIHRKRDGCLLHVGWVISVF